MAKPKATFKPRSKSSSLGKPTDGESVPMSSQPARRKISVIFGTRPEAIKLAPVVLALRTAPGIQCQVCVTGQHRHMLDQVLDVFSIVPDSDLNLMQPGQSLAGLTARTIESVDLYLQKAQPDLVLVQGDTTTVLCAALAAFYQRIPVGHVEAGLRTGNLDAPWPEEANRVLTSRLASLHFAPTESAKANLLREGIGEGMITVTGNTVIDALLVAVARTRTDPPVIPGLPEDVQPSVSAQGPRVVLITGHRRESFGQGFENICRAIADLAKRFPETHFIYPVHLNPNVLGPVRRILGPGTQSSSLRNVHLIEPLPYLSFVALMDRSSIILTDSGGIQEEAPSLGKPVLVMREVTERPEAIEAGTVHLVGTDRSRIVCETMRLLNDPAAIGVMSRTHNPYGDGNASRRIVKRCLEFLTCR